MAICYHCKEKKSGFSQFPSKYVGQKICFSCVKKLGLDYLLTTEESNKAREKNHYQSFEQLIQIVNERRPIYDKMDAAFQKTREFKCGNYNTIEIDESSELICIVKNSNRFYFSYSDFIRIENVDNTENFLPGQLRMSNFFIYYKLFGSNNVFITDNENSDLFSFFSSIQSHPEQE